MEKRQWEILIDLVIPAPDGNSPTLPLPGAGSGADLQALRPSDPSNASLETADERRLVEDGRCMKEGAQRECALRLCARHDRCAERATTKISEPTCYMS